MAFHRRPPRAVEQADPVAKAKLEALVQLREQLADAFAADAIWREQKGGEKALARMLVNGYPFDRLRRRLGLPPIEQASVDSDDYSSAGGAELDAIDPNVLDDFKLSDAFRAAASLGDDERTSRFAKVVLSRDGRMPIKHSEALAPLVRRLTQERRWKEASTEVDKAVGQAPEERRMLAIWKAEILRVREKQKRPEWSTGNCSRRSPTISSSRSRRPERFSTLARFRSPAR